MAESEEFTGLMPAKPADAAESDRIAFVVKHGKVTYEATITIPDGTATICEALVSVVKLIAESDPRIFTAKKLTVSARLVP